jgi:hypothetical protein
MDEFMKVNRLISNSSRFMKKVFRYVMPLKLPCSKSATRVSPQDDSGGIGNRSTRTTFADVNVSALKYNGKRANPRDPTVRLFPA